MAALSPPASGLVARYRADSVTDGGAGTASAWPDLSGNGYDLAQATAASRPAIVADGGADFGNQPVLRFDGANDLLSRATTPVLAQPFHAVAICKATGEIGNAGAVISDDNSQVTFGRDDTSDLPSIQATTYRTGTVPWPLDVPGIAEGLFDGAASLVGFNHVRSTVASPGASGLTGVMVGDWAAGSPRPFAGDIAEILVYDHALTHAERVLLARYASQRYGIALPFPQTQAPAKTGFASASTTHDVTLPAAVEAGELLLVLAAFKAPTLINTPSGWTEISQHADGAFRRALFATIADGSEGATVNVSTSAAATGAAQCYRVALWSGSLAGIEIATPADLTAGSSSPNPPSLTASWGARNNLWLALAFTEDDDAAVTGYPLGYSGGVDTVSGAGANLGAAVASARRELAATSDDPGVYTLSESEHWIADTLVVRPILDPPPLAGGAGIMAAGL